MTEIRSRKWREEVGISEDEAERRVDNAVDIICKRKEPTWLAFEFGHGAFKENIKQKVSIPKRGAKTFHADYFGFYGYVYSVLTYVRRMYPDTRKVDFLVERSGEITEILPYFYEQYETSLKGLVPDDCVGMLGKLIPGGKDRSPLQAADLVCWYLRRMRENSLEGADLDRYTRLEKKRYVIGLIPDGSLAKFGDNLKKTVASGTQEQ